MKNKNIFLLYLAVALSISCFNVNAQTRIFRQLPSDSGIGFGLSAKYNVMVRTCSESFKSVYTYGITPNDNQVTKKEHIAMFGFNPNDGPVIIRISLKNGTALNSSNIKLMNKTYKGVNTSYADGAFLIHVCQPMKQLMVRMPGDKANPLMIHVDPFENPEIPEGSKVVTFDGGENGKIHEQTAQYDRYTVANDVDAIVIEDGALFKGTIHTSNGRTKPLTIQGNGMIICRYTSKPGNSVKMQYNALELGDGDGHSIYGITMVNGRHFAVRMDDDAHVQNVKFYGYRNNNDGIVAKNNSVIENCFFKCNDDHIKLYYNAKITVRNCVFYEQSNGAIFQMAWNKIDPADNSLIENIEVLEWEAGCGDPDLGQGGIARSFINHRESEENGKKCINVTFRNVYIQPEIARFICINGLDHGVNYENLILENFTLEKAPGSYNWIYANPGDDNSTSVEIKFKNVRFGSRFISESDFKTKGTVDITIDTNGTKYTGKMNADEADSCDICANVDIQEITTNSNIKIYPCPANAFINIELKELKAIAQVSLYDVNGRLVLTQNINSAVQRIDTKNLNKGVYLVNITNGDDTITNKVLIE